MAKRVEPKIGDLVKAHREAAGLSQVELGRLIDKSDSVVSQWERPEPNRKMPQLANLYRTARALGISMGELFAPPGAVVMTENEREVYLLQQFRKMPDSRQKEVLLLIRSESP